MAPCDDKIAHMIGNAVSETSKLAVDSFRASKLRFVLTAIGMIGKQYVLDTLQKIGTN
jgi:hypothetical protein